MSTDYTSKDKAALYERLHGLARSIFPDWPDAQIKEVSNVFLECFSDIGDMLAFYQDANALETRVTTATQRGSMYAHAKLVGYVIPSATAATVDVELVLSAPAAADILIPNGYVIRTPDSDPIEFQVMNGAPNVILAAGQTSVSLSLENSRTVADVFASDGLANQKRILVEPDFLDGSETVVAANGVYTRVDTILRSSSSDRHYTIATDRNGRGVVRFGNGALGAIPQGDVTVSYRVGGGTRGRVPAGALRKADAPLFDVVGTPVVFTVSNAIAADGGTNRPGVGRIREELPAFVRATTRTVSLPDFVDHVRELAQVARVLAYTKNQVPSVAENTTVVVSVPVGGGVPDAALRALIYNQLTVRYPVTNTHRVVLEDPTFKTVDIIVYAVFTRQIRTSTVASMRSRMAAFFSVVNADGTLNPGMDFGGNLPGSSLGWSDAFNVARDTVGVKRIAGTNGFFLNGSQSDVPLLPHEFPRLGSCTIIDAETGESLLACTFTISLSRRPEARPVRTAGSSRTRAPPKTSRRSSI